MNQKTLHLLFSSVLTVAGLGIFYLTIRKIQPTEIAIWTIIGLFLGMFGLNEVWKGIK